ncbi:diguanylate cyclase [Herbaspirillum hiltneri N3]|uniref:histidine kinase n=1 Tax=Herbaspirillum hiltneri N3 TaxID=1262470 RepID=A0ABM5V3M7_9BURK|nr:ATP-binding protein [Herbaspirillum hiltneri]AKZ64226.1 diguanylate cyclase [Herbaspirillum hiltneri N3]
MSFVQSQQASLEPQISEFFDGCPVPAFAIDSHHVITHWNKACEHVLGVQASQMVGTRNQWKPFYLYERPVLADLIVAGSLENVVGVYYHDDDKFRSSVVIPGAVEAERFFPHLGDSGRWLYFSAAPLRAPSGEIVGAIEVLQDISAQKTAELDLRRMHQELEMLVVKRTHELAATNAKMEEDILRRTAAEAELVRRNSELTELNRKLSMTQEQLMQSEKLASIGQLAAGVAHEINNPIGYIFSNFSTLETYVGSLLRMLGAYEAQELDRGSESAARELAAVRDEVEIDFLKEDIPALMSESREGITRVRKIVQDLKDFSRADTALEWQWANLHQGIDSTLNIVNNEIKYKADVVKNYGVLPDVECLPSQINQVVMNLVVNAAHAIDGARGTITITTRIVDTGADVEIEIADNGSGITPENLSRIFDPFFTTKPVGQGTGLGLSLAYGIMQKHHGSINVRSELGAGTTFTLRFPIRHDAGGDAGQGTSGNP